MSGSTTAMVANPAYTDLSNLYTQLQRDAPAMSGALSAADKQMAAGQTWVGPTGQGWGSQLSGYSRDCAAQVNGLLSDLEQAMASTPQQCTQQEAQSYNKMKSLMARGM